MYLEKRNNGYWYLWYRDHGGRICKVSIRTKMKPEANEFLRAFKIQTHKVVTEDTRLTVSAFLRRYLDYSQTQHAPATTRAIETAFHEFMNMVGDCRMVNVQPKDIVDFLIAKRKNTKESTAVRYYACLKSAFEFAVQQCIISENPFREVRPPRMKEVIPEFFTPVEIRLILSKVNDKDFHDLITTAYLTGLRQGELLSLEWQDIDFKRAILMVKNKKSFTTKSKKNRIVPINEQLLPVFMRRKKVSSCSLVFQNNGKKFCPFALSKRFKKLIRSNGLNERLTWHSLRHSFASALAQTGHVSLYEIQKLLGHSTPTMTMRYSHLLPNTMHGVVDRLKF